MFIIVTFAAVVLAAMLTMSANMKLRQDEKSVVRITHGVVDVPLRLFPVPAAPEARARSFPSE